MNNQHQAQKRSLVISGLGGNEAFCLRLKGYHPGQMVVGNSVQSLGVFGGITAGARNVIGGESVAVTNVVKRGRDAALHKLENEAGQVNASGVTGVTSGVKTFAGKVEFLAKGSAVTGSEADPFFMTSFSGKELYCMLDAGYKPMRYVFGNIAYSVGLGGNLMAGLKTLVGGEIREFSNILNKTRHAALDRMTAEAGTHGANVVLGVEVDLMNLANFREMLMFGTAAYHPFLPKNQVASCDLTCDELWSMANMGYAPIKIVMGTAVYSIGVVGGIMAAMKALRQGEVPELTKLVYDAREHALDLIEREAKACGADMVIGTDVYIQELGNGLVEFMAIGTAMKEVRGMKTTQAALPAQATAEHRSTFRNSLSDMLAGATDTV